MKQLEKLPEMSNEMLGGLHAAQDLKEEILRDGALARKDGKKHYRNTPWAAVAPEKRRATRAGRVLATVCTFAFVIGLLVGIPTMISTPQTDNGALISTQVGGDPGTQETVGTLARDLPKGSITITQSQKPAYRGIWASANGANFPLVCVNGRYYRLLTNPTSLGSDLTGSSLGTVDTYTDEPSLLSDGIFSNVVAQGETVYSVSGMNGAMIAARVDGAMRVFQRVSFGNSALKGGESLADTLQAGNVVAMELTGVGTVTDADTAKSLYNTLIGNASLARSAAGETGTSLLIQLSNGLTLQMSVRDESVMACGTWNCPEFFEAFSAAVQ